MVGMVVVSHSAKVAEGAVELAKQMAPEAPLVAAGGLPDGGIGTDYDTILNAIESVMSEDGVVMLVDLGSAIMTSEMAIDDCSDPDKVKIIDAPIVEGTVYGAIQCSIGSPMEVVEMVLAEAKSVAKF